MSTIGKVCLGFTVLGVIAAAGWLFPMLGTIHNQWSKEFRDGKANLEKQIAAHKEARTDLQIAEAELARLQLGWDKSWIVPTAGQGQSVVVQGNRIAVTGLGTQSGLVARNVTDANGVQQPVRPVVHAFRGTADNLVYIGEFVADVNQLGPNNVVLVPAWSATAEEYQSWQVPQAQWRFRTIVPPAPRRAMDELNRRITNIRELYAETQQNIQQQEALLAAATAQLEIRKKELLGNPEGNPELPPEFVDGLLATIENEEEERNLLQLSVDSLRRLIKQSSDERQVLAESLRELVSRLPEPTEKDTQVSSGDSLQSTTETR